MPKKRKKFHDEKKHVWTGGKWVARRGVLSHLLHGLWAMYSSIPEPWITPPSLEELSAMYETVHKRTYERWAKKNGYD